MSHTSTSTTVSLPSLLTGGPRVGAEEDGKRPVASKVGSREEAIVEADQTRAAEAVADADALPPSEEEGSKEAVGSAAFPNHDDDADDGEGDAEDDEEQSADNDEDREAFWLAAQQALGEKDRREKVDAFLKKHGFAGVNRSKGWLLTFTYPLHVAVEENNLEIVQLLLKSRANRNLRDAHGRTARALARKLNKNMSHMPIIRALAVRRNVLKCDAATEMTPVAGTRDAEVEASNRSINFKVETTEMGVQCDLQEYL